MEELCYSALDIAAVIAGMELGCQAQAEFLDRVWENERPYIQKNYRSNKRQMILDVSYWLTYFGDKPAIDAEFPIVQKDAQTAGRALEADAYTTETSGLDLFFKSARLRILDGGGKPYVRVKRRTLMGKYGYKRLSPGLIEYFHQCTYFYHLQPYVKDYVECRIEDVGIDEMIVLRVI